MQFVRTIRFTAVLGFALASSLCAQHGSTGHTGVAGPGFAPGAQRGAVAASPNIVQRPGLNLGGRPYPIRTDIPAPVGLNPPASAYTGILPGGLKSVNGYRGYGSRGFPIFAAAPLFWSPYIDPGFSSFGDYNGAPPIDPNAQALADSQESLAQQIQQLTAEVQSLKNSGQQQQLPPAPASAVAERRPPTPPVTLILRDGQQLTVESYAIMNQTFWNFSKRPVQKIPISNIDIAASTKATEANGGEFPQISSAQ